MYVAVDTGSSRNNHGSTYCKKWAASSLPEEEIHRTRTDLARVENDLDVIAIGFGFIQPLFSLPQ